MSRRSNASSRGIGAGTTTQSYTVSGMSVQDIADFYEVELANLGWSSVQAAPAVGDGDWHSEWTRGSERLVVSASAYEDDQVTSQLDSS